MDIAISVNKIPIRIPEERWFHITEGHNELAGYYYEIIDTIENPEIIFAGNNEERIALKHVSETHYLAAVYKEISENDGFLITAYLTSRIKQYEKRAIIWDKNK